MKQLAKLVKVRYVEDITHSERVGTALHMRCGLEMPQKDALGNAGNMHSQ